MKSWGSMPQGTSNKAIQLSTDFILLGSGGHARSVFSLLEGIGITSSLAAVCSPNPDFAAPLSKFTYYSDLVLAVRELGIGSFVNGVGLGHGLQVRREVSVEAKKLGLLEVELVSPQAYVAPRAILMEGVQVFHRAVVNAGSQIGAGTIVNTSSVVEHDVVTGENCFLGPGSLLLGEVKLEDDVLVGAGAVIHPGVTISKRTKIGSGSVVLHDITEPGTYVGVPARRVNNK